MDRRLFLALGGIGLVGAGGFAWLSGRRSGVQAPLPGMAEAQTEGVEAGEEDFARVPDMALGRDDAPVEVIEYGSLTCPHCANFAVDVFPRLRENYIDPGHVRFIHREVYFDRYGLWAAMLARCGDESRYFPMLHRIYESQREWAGTNDPAEVAENLRRLGRQTGLTNDEVDACLMDDEMARSMVAVYQAHAVEHEVNSTPTFIIDGEKHPNMGYDDFAAILDANLES